MPEISGNDLMMCVQAVEYRIRALEQEADQVEGLAARDLEDLLMGYIATASALRKGYEQALKLSGNLPPYSTLVPEE